jgi:hypothetical protein
MTKAKGDTHAARDKRDQLLAERFERENWSLPLGALWWRDC